MTSYVFIAMRGMQCAATADATKTPSTRSADRVVVPCRRSYNSAANERSTAGRRAEKDDLRVDCQRWESALLPQSRREAIKGFQVQWCWSRGGGKGGILILPPPCLLYTRTRRVASRLPPHASPLHRHRRTPVGLPVSAVTSPPVVISTRGIPLSSHRFAPPEIGRPATTSSPNDLIADPKLTMEPPESNISAAAAAAAAALEATSHADMLQQLRTRQTQRLARELAQ
ncbi:uncharacterized protein J3D65DRAFT_607219 [Phyllosticta citribraziliensis]|uniref:Uncharacterized protein n=1 Tax=Phyllosticta citribraziliensis TaxID=989973 RepID=A0ABR1L9E1_9PEZI